MGHRRVLLIVAAVFVVTLALVRLDAAAEVDPGVQRVESGGRGGSGHEEFASGGLGEDPGPRRAIFGRPDEHIESGVADGIGEDDAAGHSIRVRVVQGPQSRAVAGAKVHFFARGPDEVSSSRDGLRAFATASGVARFEKFGEHRLTDGHGWVTIPLTGWGARCFAAKDRAIGALNVPGASPGSRHVITLEADVSVRVRVVDPAGEPVGGVGVQLVHSAAAAGLAPAGDRGGFVVTCGRSRAGDGILRLAHLQQARAKWPVDPNGVRRTRIHLEVLGTRERGVPLDLESLSTQPRGSHGRAPIDLRMPHVGHVVVVVRDTEGRRTHDGDLVELTLAEDRSDGSSCRLLRGRVRGGQVGFRHVALGTELRATLRRGSKRFDVTFAGPRLADETVRREVRIAVRDFLVAGRACDRSGAPLGDVDVVAEAVEWSGRGFVRASGQTDAEGRFELAWRGDRGSDREGDLGPVHLRVEHRGEVLVGRGAAPGALRPGLSEIGDVRCHTAHVLVSGRLVDAGDRAVRGGRGLAESLSPAVGYQEPGRDPKNRNAWRRVRPFRADAQGRFAILGEAPSGPCRLSVRAPGFASPPPVEFQPGDTSVKVVLAAAGRLKLRVRADASTSESGIRFHWVGPDRTRVVAWRRSETRAADGWVCRWEDVEPGRYRIECLRAKDAALLAVLPDVEVRQGEETVRTVDLRPARR